MFPLHFPVRHPTIIAIFKLYTAWATTKPYSKRLQLRCSVPTEAATIRSLLSPSLPRIPHRQAQGGSLCHVIRAFFSDSFDQLNGIGTSFAFLCIGRSIGGLALDDSRHLSCLLYSLYLCLENMRPESGTLVKLDVHRDLRYYFHWLNPKCQCSLFLLQGYNSCLI